jgi:hypothetical protein
VDAGTEVPAYLIPVFFSSVSSTRIIRNAHGLEFFSVF